MCKIAQNNNLVLIICQDLMHISEFDYFLPENLIAQEPASPRDSSRLLVFNKKTNIIRDDVFRNISDHLNPGDLLVFNDSYVFPARLNGTKKSGKRVEVLLLSKESKNEWRCVLTPGIKNNQRIIFSESLFATVKNTPYNEKERVLVFNVSGEKLWQEIYLHGNTPLPPYIKPRGKSDKNDYQTIFAQSTKKGSAAAPTAGLHFTDTVFNSLKKRGVKTAFCTLHVGLGTFEPVHQENVSTHQMHSEYFSIEKNEFEKIKKAKNAGKRIIAVGTTSTRVLETIFSAKSANLSGKTNIFIYPGYRFKAIDGLITNFHLPKSTLIMLVSALAGTEETKRIYKHAINEHYRFYSYGDAMFVI